VLLHDRLRDDLGDAAAALAAKHTTMFRVGACVSWPAGSVGVVGVGWLGRGGVVGVGWGGGGGGGVEKGCVLLG